jgi:mRNA-degrading endonuclease RelE of RelBE toxin-antitoxin system
VALDIQLSNSALKYLDSLDQTMKRRIAVKLRELADDPFNIRLSKPVVSAAKRTARVGAYRILFVVVESDPSIPAGVLLVSDIGPRGQIYRKA